MNIEIKHKSIRSFLELKRKPIKKSLGLPVFACEIDEKDDTGISAISFVDAPAVEVDFVALSRQKAKHQLHLNEDKQILTGVVLQPGQLIYRQDDTNGEYYITFSEQTIEKIARKMMRTGIALQNTTHQHQVDLSGNYMTEIWIVENPEQDKSKALGFEGLAKGTLMCSYRVADTEYWKSEVKTGKVKGFSLEGFFYQNKINMNKKTKTNLGKKALPKKQNKLAALLHSMGVRLEDETSSNESSSVAEKDETGSGIEMLAFELVDGSIIQVDADSIATLNSEQAPAGSHELADGNFIVIDDEGYFVATQAEGEDPQAEVPNAELSYHKRSKNATQMAKLKARISKLERTPTARPIRPAESGAGQATHYGRMAEVAKLSLKKS